MTREWLKEIEERQSKVEEHAPNAGKTQQPFKDRVTLLKALNKAYEALEFYENHEKNCNEDGYGWYEEIVMVRGENGFEEQFRRRDYPTDIWAHDAGETAREALSYNPTQEETNV